MRTAASARQLIARICKWKPGSLARGSLYALFGQIARAVFLAAYLLLLVQAFEPETYGEIVALVSIAAICGAASGGGGLMLMRDAAKDAAQLPQAWQRALGSHCLLVIPGCIVIALAASLLFQSPLPWPWLLLIAAAELLLNPVSTSASFAFQSQQNLGMTALLQTAPVALRLASAAVLFGLLGTSLPSFACAHLLGSFMATVFCLWAARQHFELKLRPILAPWGWWQQNAGFAAMYVTAGATVDLDKSLVAHNGGNTLAGEYNLGYRLSMMLAMPVIALSQSVLPRIARLREQAPAHARRLLLISALCVAGFCAVASAALGMAAPLAVSLMPRLSPISPCLPGFCALLCVFCLRYLASSILQIDRNPWRRVALDLPAVGLLILLNGPLVARFGLGGALGAALGSESWLCIASWCMVLRSLNASQASRA